MVLVWTISGVAMLSKKRLTSFFLHSLKTWVSPNPVKMPPYGITSVLKQWDMWPTNSLWLPGTVSWLLFKRLYFFYWNWILFRAANLLDFSCPRLTFEIIKILAEWILLCMDSLLACRNLALHPANLHSYGLSPVWTLMWSLRYWGRVNILPQYSHSQSFCSLCRVSCLCRQYLLLNSMLHPG